MAKTFQLDIVASDRKFFSGRCEKLVFPALDGECGILPGHESMVTCLAAGECLLPAVNAALERGMPFGGMHALYVRKSQAEEGRK